MVLFGRNSESPVPVLAPSTPGQCFDMAVEAARIAIKYRTPVYLLSDAYLANGVRAVADPGRRRRCRTSRPTFATRPNDGEFLPYAARPRDARAAVGDPGHARPRAPDRRAREGRTCTGNVSYDPDNHDPMTRLRAQKVAGIAADIPELEVDDPDGDATLLVLGWGGTYGPIAAGVRRVRASAAARSRTRTCTTSTRSRATRARCCAATSACSSRR